MNTRTECSPRIIKRINVKEKPNDASKYGFYRQINHLSIMRLVNETDKMNYSSWLTRLDNETSDLKTHLIKILFISLRSDKSFQFFLKPPPDDLNDLELRADNTMDMVKWLQDNNITDESPTNEEEKQGIKHRRSAAVATNMRSYTTIKTSPYFVQSFYVRSDWPIYTWYNPTSIQLPSNFDHNQWELFLNRFQIVTEDKKFNNKHRNECDDIIPIDQISKEITTTFNWHPYSILASEENRPKRTAGFIMIDLDIANHQCNQQEIDDAAFAIVSCKVFPGNKILSQKIYSDTLIPDPKFIFKMTGVTLVNYSNLKLTIDEKLPFICKLKQRKRAVKNRCGVKPKSPCPCEKPMMTINCSKPQLPCSTENTQQVIQIKPSITTCISTTNKNTNTVITESDSKFSNLNMTYQECKSNSKCLKRNVKKTKSVENCKFPKEADLNVDNCNNESNELKNCTTVLNAGSASLDDSSNYDWTVSSVEISTSEPNRACSNTSPATEAPNCDANSTSISRLDKVKSILPADKSARHCSGVQMTAAAAATTPCQSPRTAESVRESPQERRDGTNLARKENGRCVDTVFGNGRRPVQRMSAEEPRDKCGNTGGSTSDVGRKVGTCPVVKDRNHSCPAALAEHQPKRPDTSAVSRSNRSAGQLQQQHESVVLSSNNNRLDTATPAPTAWDPEVSNYSDFSNRHMAEDRSRFLTSERTVDVRPAATRPQLSSPLLQLATANDFHSTAAGTTANDDNVQSDDANSSDWSDEVGFDCCQSCVGQTNRFRGFGGDNNNNYDTASSLSTLTSSDSSIEIRLAARYPVYARQVDNRQSINNNDRYPFDGSGVADVWPPAYDLIEDVSMPGPLVTGPWSLSMNDSRNSRAREFGDVRAPDQYNTSCSEGGNASGRDDYDGSETYNDGEDIL